MALVVLGLAPSAWAAPAPVTGTPGSIAGSVEPGPTGAAKPRAKRGFRLTERQVIAIARRHPRLRDTLHRHPDAVPSVEARRPGDDLVGIPRNYLVPAWEVRFFDPRPIVLAVILDRDRRVIEAHTGYQAVWPMARGYPGFFGGRINALYVWLPLSALFLFGLADWRRPWRMVHLDLLMLLGFGVSHAFFNHGEIGVSVPLVYPFLVYLLLRLLWIGFRGRGPGLRPTAPASWLLIAALFLVGFRLALNFTESSVIDVGFAGVIGGDRASAGLPIYGEFPPANTTGDTYGPFNYYAYLPFEQAFPWSGSWDSLPAAHAAAIAFDLAALVGLFFLGRRLRPGEDGTELGIVLAFAWAAFPYTAFSLESNSNDTLVAALVIATFLVIFSAPARGGVLALTAATKFAPLALAPLLATYRESSDDGPRLPWPTVAAFSAGFVLVGLAVMAETILDPGLGTFFDRTLGSQLGRSSPFSIWGQTDGYEWAKTALKVAAAALALLVALIPRRKTIWQVAALGGTVLIAPQLFAEHWFYFYIVWFLPLVLVALAAPTVTEPPSTPARSTPPARPA